MENKKFIKVIEKVLEKLADLDDDVLEKILNEKIELNFVALGSDKVENEKKNVEKIKPVEKEDEFKDVKLKLETLESRKDGETYLETLKLTVPKLKKLAKELKIGIKSKIKKSEVIELIIDGTVGVKLRQRALKSGMK